MKSIWDDEDAAAAVAHYREDGINADIALRVYTSRLLGGDPRLVLHGGGNTSVKTTLADLMDDDCEVVCVKGSGWDLADIEPAGLPALRLEPLRRLIRLDALNDEDMVNAQRGQLLDSTSPNPSVETLLHAFLPDKFVDHTHANPVLVVTDQPNGAEICADIFGERAPVVPYVMPGFALAKLAAKTNAGSANSEGLVLLKHGIFSYGAGARESYERMISLVSLAEAYIESARTQHFVVADLPFRAADVAKVAPVLRGAIAQCVDKDEGLWRRQVLEFRTSESILGYVNGKDIERYSQIGVVTPDHTIRTKNAYPHPMWKVLRVFCCGPLGPFVDDYCVFAQSGRHPELDPKLGAGKSAREAKIAADIAEHYRGDWRREAIGRYQPVGARC